MQESRSMTSGLWPSHGLCPLRAVSLAGYVPWFVTDCCLWHWGSVTFLLSLSPFSLPTCCHFWSHIPALYREDNQFWPLVFIFDHMLPLLFVIVLVFVTPFVFISLSFFFLIALRVTAHISHTTCATFFSWFFLVLFYSVFFVSYFLPYDKGLSSSQYFSVSLSSSRVNHYSEPSPYPSPYPIPNPHPWNVQPTARQHTYYTTKGYLTLNLF